MFDGKQKLVQAEIKQENPPTTGTRRTASGFHIIMPHENQSGISLLLRKGPEAWLFLLAVFVAYAACAFVPYVHSDDYGQMLYIMEGWSNWVTNSLARDGRPITSALIHYGFLACGTLGKLWILRLIALAGLLLFARYFRKTMAGLGFNNWQSTLLTSLVVFSPGIGEYVGWTVSWPYPFLLLFITWLSQRFCRMVDDNTPGRTALICLCTVLLLEISFFMYQSIAGLMLVIPLLYLHKGKMRPILLTTGVLFVAFVGYKFLIFPNLHFLSPRWGATDRANIVSDLPGHWLYLMKEFPTFISSSWARLLLPRGGYILVGSLVIAFAIAGCLVVTEAFRGWKKVAAPAITLCALAMTSPQVFVLGDIWAFRTNYPMAAAISILAWTGLHSLARPALRPAVNAGIFLLLFVGAALSVNIGFAYTAMREYRINQTLLENFRDTGARKAFILITPDRFDQQPPVPIHWHSCYGFLSLVLMNEMEPKVVAREIWPDPETRPEFTFVKADDLTHIPQDGTPVIDLWGAIHGTPSIPLDAEAE